MKDLKHPITEEDPQSRIDALVRKGVEMQREIEALEEAWREVVAEHTSPHAVTFMAAEVAARISAKLAEPEGEVGRLN